MYADREQDKWIQKIETGVEQECIFLIDLVYLYSEIIPRWPEDLPGFIIDRHNLHDIRYANVTALITDAKRNPEKTIRQDS